MFSSGECQSGSLPTLEALAGAGSPLMIAESLLYAYLLAGNAGSLLGCSLDLSPLLTKSGFVNSIWPLLILSFGPTH